MDHRLRVANETASLEGEPRRTQGWRQRFSGGRVSGTVIRLIIVSLVVGLFLSILGLNPIEFWRGIGRALEAFIRTLGSSAIEIAGNLLRYIAFGAAIVVPVWIVIRLFSGRSR